MKIVIPKMMGAARDARQTPQPRPVPPENPFRVRQGQWRFGMTVYLPTRFGNVNKNNYSLLYVVARCQATTFLLC
jgi:hypothetical protein